MSLKSALRMRLGALRQSLVRLHRRVVPLEWEIARALRGRREVFFVQVGSNDGTSGDPIHKLLERHKQWRGIFIEPVPSLFERLKANHPDSGRYVFENVAIGKERGEAVFHYVSEDAKAALGEKLPYWYDQLGSFDRQHILKHLDGLLEPFIVSQPLPCLPLQDVLDRNQVQRLDLLHIDTEGYDWQVLSQFDLARYQPKVVLYEHKHLSREDRRRAEALLRQHGYRLQVRSADTLARR